MKQARQENYYGVWYGNKRIGYVVERLRPEPERNNFFQLDQEALINLKVLDTIQPINMHLSGRLDEQMRLQDFSFTFSSAFYQMEAKGKVSGNTVAFTLDTGQTVIKIRFHLINRPCCPSIKGHGLYNSCPTLATNSKYLFSIPFL